MIGNSMLIRRGLPVAVVMVAAILLQPGAASAGGYFSLSLGFHYPYHGYYHGHHPYYWGYYHWPVPYWGWAPRVAEVGWEAARNSGAVKLKVRPKKTDVYVDGRYVGRAGKLDGYPGYLWLERGTHTLTFFKEGYRTFSQTVEVRAGMITDVRLEMVPGESAPPREQRPTPPPPAPPPPAPERRGAAEPSRPAPGAERTGETILDLRNAGAQLRLEVRPADASVYLDGRFLGTGAEISRLHEGLLVEAGEHVVEVVHPRYEADRVSFRVREGESLALRVELEAQTSESP